MVNPSDIAGQRRRRRIMVNPSDIAGQRRRRRMVNPRDIAGEGRRRSRRRHPLCSLSGRHTLRPPRGVWLEGERTEVAQQGGRGMDH